MSLRNLHGSESSNVRAKEGIIVLNKEKTNRAQWKREILAGLRAKGIENMAIYGWSKLLTLVQAMDHDTDGQAKRKLKTLNTLAALAEEEKGTTVMPTFADRVQAAAGASTPMKRPLETELQFNQRRTIEQAGTAYSSALLPWTHTHTSQPAGWR